MSLLELRLERDRFVPGDWIAGAAIAHVPLKLNRLEVVVRLWERSPDYREEVLTGRTGPLHQGPIERPATFPFHLQLPPQVLPPYATRWGELYWEVDAWGEVGFDRDLHDRRRILVLPPGVGEDQLGERGARLPDGVLGGIARGVAQVAGAAPAAAGAPGAHAAPGSFPSAWYPDPWLERRLRWWDGERWTPHLHG